MIDKKLNDCPHEYNKRHDFHRMGKSDSVYACVYCGQVREVVKDGVFVIDTVQVTDSRPQP